MKLPTTLFTSTLITLLILPWIAIAATIRGRIPSTQLLPNPSVLPAETSLTLTTSGQTYTTRLRRDNTFVFRNVTGGSYILDISCPTYHFAPLRVDVARDGGVEVHQTFRGNAWSNKGEARTANPIDILPMKKAELFVEREGFSPLKLLGNPMMLFAILALGGVILLPKLMDKIDPEMRAEFEEQQKKSSLNNAATNPMGNFDIASFLAGTSSPGSAAQGQGNNKGAGGRKKA